MARQVLPFEVTVPAGTPKTAPVTKATPLGYFIVVSVEVDVPPGPNGLMGFKFTTGGVAMIPPAEGNWIVASGDRLNWPLTGAIETGAWEVTAYNTGIYDHTIYIRYLVDLPGAGAVVLTPQLAPIAAIMGDAGGVTAGAAPGSAP